MGWEQCEYQRWIYGRGFLGLMIFFIFLPAAPLFIYLVKIYCSASFKVVFNAQVWKFTGD
ncbi:unnamed protein product, partial [Allacma fusca]